MKISIQLNWEAFWKCSIIIKYLIVQQSLCSNLLFYTVAVINQSYFLFWSLLTVFLSFLLHCLLLHYFCENKKLSSRFPIFNYFQPEEENLRIQLEALQAEMSAPTQFKGRLNELLSQVRLQSQASAMSGGCEKYNMDPYLLSDIKALLKQQQDGLHVRRPKYLSNQFQLFLFNK